MAGGVVQGRVHRQGAEAEPIVEAVARRVGGPRQLQDVGGTADAVAHRANVGVDLAGGLGQYVLDRRAN